jgi:hypothetical protein
MTDEARQPDVDAPEIAKRSFQDVVQGAEALGAVSLGLGTAGIAVAKLKETFGGNSRESTARLRARHPPHPRNPSSAEPGDVFGNVPRLADVRS